MLILIDCHCIPPSLAPSIWYLVVEIWQTFYIHTHMLLLNQSELHDWWDLFLTFSVVYELSSKLLNARTNLMSQSGWLKAFELQFNLRPQLWFPWLSLPICPYHPSPPGVLPKYCLVLHRADVNKFLLVCQHWHIYMEFRKKAIIHYNSCTDFGFQ